jgi:hypothetical protein
MRHTVNFNPDLHFGFNSGVSTGVKIIFRMFHFCALLKLFVNSSSIYICNCNLNLKFSTAVKMEGVQKYIHKYNKIASELTEHFLKVGEHKDAAKFYIAYVYFMKSLYELRYHYELGKLAKTSGTTVAFDEMKRLIDEINKTVDKLKSLTKEMNIEIKGSNEILNFYKNHKSQFKKWNVKTPREKIIKTLELWTGERGESAVLRTLNLMIHNVNYLFDYVMDLNHENIINNHAISHQVNSLIMQMYKYYLKHRKYAFTADSREIITSDKSIKIHHKDPYLDINIKLKKCFFNNVAVNIEHILNGICKVDHAFVTRSVKSFIQSGGATNFTIVENFDPFYRINLMRRIHESARKIQDDLQCNTKKIEMNLNSNEELLKFVQKFVELEEEAVKISDKIREDFEYQASNLNILTNHIQSLIGPDTTPCVWHVCNFVVAVFAEYMKSGHEIKNMYKLEYGELLNKKKLTKQGEAFIAQIFKLV